MSFQMKKVAGPACPGCPLLWGQAGPGNRALKCPLGCRDVSQDNGLKEAAGTEGNGPLRGLTHTCSIWYLWGRERLHLSIMCLGIIKY